MSFPSNNSTAASSLPTYTAYPLGPEFSAFAKIMNGRLSLGILYLDTDMDDTTANQIADSCVNLLQQPQ